MRVQHRSSALLVYLQSLTWVTTPGAGTVAVRTNRLSQQQVIDHYHGERSEPKKKKTSPTRTKNPPPPDGGRETLGREGGKSETKRQYLNIYSGL